MTKSAPPGAKGDFDAFWSRAIVARSESLRGAEPTARELAGVERRVLTAARWDLGWYALRLGATVAAASGVAVLGGTLALRAAPHRTFVGREHGLEAPIAASLPRSMETPEILPAVQAPKGATVRPVKLAASPRTSAARRHAIQGALTPPLDGAAEPAQASPRSLAEPIATPIAEETASEANAVAQILAKLNVAGDAEGALQAIARYRIDHREGQLRFAVARAEVAADLRLGRSDQALDCLDRLSAVSAAMRDPELEATRAELLQRHGRGPEARAVWQALLSAELTPGLRSRVVAALSAE